MLQDGNSALYSLAKDCTDGIRDPLWIDLPPIQAMSIGLQSLYNVAPNCKNKVAIIAVALQVRDVSHYVSVCTAYR